MTRQYRIQKVTGEPDWDKIEKAPLDQRLWRPCEAISAYAQLAYDESRLYVHLHAEEAQIRAENSGVLDQPCQDSCLEFFLGRVDRMRLLLPGGGKTLNACCERTATGWDVAYELPFKLLQLFFPDFSPSGKIRGNFYKCGDLTAQEHYLAWNRVDAERPDFHLPKYFGALIFSE